MKKAISLLLAAMMLLGIAACGKPAEPAASGSGSQSGEDEQIVLTIGVPAKTNITDYENNLLTLWIEEQTGYDLQFVYFSSTGSELKTQVSTMVASGEPLPDIMYYFNFSKAEEATYGKDGYFLDLANYFDNPEVMAKYDYDEMVKKNLEPETLKRLYTEGRDASGHWYGFPCTASSITDRPRNMLYINQKWLDTLGLEMPRTFDELVHVLREFISKDPNGNGKADEMGLVGSTKIARGDIPSWLINRRVYINDNHMLNCDDDGKLYLPYDMDEYREGIKDVKYLYDEGLIAPMTWTISESSELPPLFTPVDRVARCGVWAGHISLRVEADNPVLYEYEPLLPLEGSYAAVEPVEVYYHTYISSECKHPDAAWEVLMLLASPEGSRRQRYGAEGEDWEWVTDYESGVKGIKILNQDAYSGQTHSTFGMNGAVTFWPYDPLVDTDRDPSPGFLADPEPPREEKTWGEFRSDLGMRHAEGYLAIAEQNNPKNLIYKGSLIYTDEELEALGNIRTDISDYVKTARAEFITGVRNVNDDKEWADYCKTLKDLGTDKWLEIAQIAYDRTQAQANS